MSRRVRKSNDIGFGGAVGLLSFIVAVPALIIAIVASAGSSDTSTDIAVNTTGLYGFYWEVISGGNSGQSSAFAQYEPLTGVRQRTVGYYFSEDRTPAVPNRFNGGPEPGSLFGLYQTTINSEYYLINRNINSGNATRVTVGTLPANHAFPKSLDFDPVSGLYVASGEIGGGGDTGLMHINGTTGEVTPFTGAAGSLYPNGGPVILDTIIIGDRVVVSYRDDTVTGRLAFFNRSDGQYLSTSVNTGQIVPFPGTFLDAWLEPKPELFFSGLAYDAASVRLHVIATYWQVDPRNLAYIEAETEAELLANLQSGNYNITMAQVTTAPFLNGLAWIK